MANAEVLSLSIINKFIEHAIQQLNQNNRLCQTMTLDASCVTIQVVLIVSER